MIGNMPRSSYEKSIHVRIELFRGIVQAYKLKEILHYESCKQIKDRL